TPSIRRGVPPATDMRHRVVIPPRSDGKMISRESGVQAGALGMYILSKVSLRAWPPFEGITYRSSTSPGPEVRRKAMDRPSGEKTGAQSEYGTGGVVRKRSDKSLTDNSAITRMVDGGLVVLIANVFPPGDQETSRVSPATTVS